MRRQAGWWVGFAVLTAGLWALRCDAGLGNAAAPFGGRMVGLPRLTVWAWERREDLRGVDATTTAVAYLDRTLILDGHGLTVKPQRQALLLPASVGLVRIPVVRIETTTDAVLNDAMAEVAASAIAGSAAAGTAALQIDFDARKSEREWYRAVLTRVRAKMSAGIPLSMTALASWCSYDNAWMAGLPVDEAVPMLFRMEPDRKQAMQVGAGERVEFVIREPLCRGSVGISTRERWPREMTGKRVYVFADEGWRRDGLEETVKKLW